MNRRSREAVRADCQHAKIVFDPRDGEFKTSDNPGLILGMIAYKSHIYMGKPQDCSFWTSVGAMADYYDDPQDTAKQVRRSSRE